MPPCRCQPETAIEDQPVRRAKDRGVRRSIRGRRAFPRFACCRPRAGSGRQLSKTSGERPPEGRVIARDKQGLWAKGTTANICRSAV